MTAVPALHGSRFHQPSRTAGTAPSTRQTITLHTATALPDLASELVRHVAAPAFAAPPWHDTPADIDTLCRRLLHDGRRSGFRFAWAQNHGQPIGFAYGAHGTHHALTRLADAALQPVPFELCELAVTPAARGHGVGAALHDLLMSGIEARRAWLLTHPLATPALHLYRTRGWRCHPHTPPPTTTSSRILMIRDQTASPGPVLTRQEATEPPSNSNGSWVGA